MEALGLVVGFLVLSLLVVRTIVRVTRRTLGTSLRITSEETIQKATRKMQEQFAAASRRDSD
jgi:hypothetical protein